MAQRALTSYDRLSRRAARVPQPTTAVQTVVCADLMSYSDKAALLEEALGVEGTFAFNKQIQALIGAAMVEGSATATNILAHTGDGVLARFDDPRPALAFARSLHAVSRAHNKSRRYGAAKRVFRIGVATGELRFDAAAPTAGSCAGMVIVRATRLEAAAAGAGILVDRATWAGLSATERATFEGPMMVVGKRGERIEAYRARPGRAARVKPAGA
jgi:class 3 adenylate cyclase